LEGNWLIEKLHVKEFERIRIRSIDGRRAYAVPVCTKSIADGDECRELTKGRIEDLAKLHGVQSSSLKVVLILGGLRPADAWTRAFPIIGIDPLKPADSARWIMERYGLSPDIARYIVENVGTDLYPLHNEIVKLQTFAGAGKPITTRDVDELVLRSEQFGPWELGDAILARDYRKSGPGFRCDAGRWNGAAVYPQPGRSSLASAVYR